MATVFGVAIAALASCQTFRETGHGARSALEEFAELDECVNHGGLWSMDAHRCELAADTANPGEAAEGSWRE
jgi:hypothetical protein